MVNQKYIHIHKGQFGFKKGNHAQKVLQAEDVSLYSGRLTALVGLNGSGKSTFLRSIAGLQEQLSGEYFLGGKNRLLLSRQELAEQIAVVLTEKIGGFNLKVRDVVASGQMPYTGAFNTLTEVQEKVIANAMQKAGVIEYADKDLLELSDGMFQKTMIAKALAQDTSVVLLDEPSAYLDFASRHQLFLLLRHLAESENKCVLVSSHDLDLALRYCHDLLIISEGDLRQLPIDRAREDIAFRQMSGDFI
jgi:iron complex transport system ATP-binding protein